MQKPTKYKLIIGERGNGKTYAAKMLIINKFIQERAKFAYVRRRKEQIARKDMKRLFSDINDIAMEPDVLGDYIKYNVEQGFYIDGDDGKPMIMGYPFSIESAVTRKGIPWHDIKYIFFDEFLEYGNAIPDELSQFMNLISTIVRNRDDVTIIMCANTVTKMSPYFELFGIDLKKLKQGLIYSFVHQAGATGSIEWCASSNITKEGGRAKNSYIGFDNNPTSNMILYGEWEYDKVNTLNIDGKGWSQPRRLIPMYVTAIGDVYELSLLEQKDPILFIRRINVQQGRVRQDIRYNLSYDSSVTLVNKLGIVPMYGKVSALMDEDTQALWRIACACISAKRVVYDTIAGGSDFMRIYQYL